jgi:hypothetical protein
MKQLVMISNFSGGVQSKAMRRGGVTLDKRWHFSQIGTLESRRSTWTAQDDAEPQQDNEGSSHPERIRETQNACSDGRVGERDGRAEEASLRLLHLIAVYVVFSVVIGPLSHALVKIIRFYGISRDKVLVQRVSIALTKDKNKINTSACNR